MRPAALSFLALACALHASAVEAQLSDADPLPGDVRAFVARRQNCDHFRGEEPYDRARATEIALRLREFCTGTDAELARLKRIHARDRAVQRALANYEIGIE